jgi:transcriptional regulator with XRE-family HTH domain
MNTSNKVHKYQEVLHSLRLRQADLATKLNISRQRISDILNGRSDFTEEQKIVLCKEYNVNLNWLLADIGSMFIQSFNEQLDNKKKNLESVASQMSEIGFTPDIVKTLIDIAKKQ